MIRSYNHKGFVLEVAIETSHRLVPAPGATHYLAIVTISRSGRPVTAFSPLCIESMRYSSFTSAEDALMSAHTAARTFVDEWVRAAS
ncbi:hypothetical protein QCE73_21910 [Caballeronia sp. LZ029]|uniref:hypothetical protein n=1 Tax=Caballeronia sp. LZ029 TaxID=3038564 RepID=UPI00045B4E38|nr:hypothetical protein [Caballeronia sp. LZ029]KAK45476.1 hypothetical protein BG58_17035 [Caballeronia jiangsuensis]MDR5745825.1 hypothetical protein [Caballeronia sp. LZ029]